MAQYEILQLAEKLKGNRIALVRFAGEADVLCPLTNDINAFRSYMDLATPQKIIQGTNIASAIKLSRKLYSPIKASNKVIVIFSDGENHQSNAVSEASNANKEDIFIFTIGIGTEKGEGYN